MILIIGGAYQGKTEFVRERFGFSEEDLRERVSVHYEDVIRAQYEAGEDPVKKLCELLDRNPGICLIADEIGRGVVPVDKEERQLREVIGRTLQEAARNAEEVYRVTCGIGEKIK